jgi:hypothetical protein
MAAESNRPSDDPIPVHNIEGLISDLGKGHTIYCRGGARAKRVGAARQLHVVLNLLTVMMPYDGAKLQPLFRLYEQLMELNRGVVGDMLTPEKRSRKPPIPSREGLERAHLAAIMHLKIEANKLAGGRGEKEKAAKEVGRRFRVGYRQVDDWREHAMRESPRNDVIAWRFQELLEWSSAHFPGRPDEAADWLMKARLGAHLAGKGR